MKRIILTFLVLVLMLSACLPPEKNSSQTEDQEVHTNEPTSSNEDSAMITTEEFHDTQEPVGTQDPDATPSSLYR